jgi:putative ABC transport system ATP-binding protein
MHITMSNVKKSYALGEGKLTILKGISLSFEKGDYVAIIGASGSGKSTLMHILGCMDQAFDGEYLLDDKPIHRVTSNALAELRRTKLGFIFQTFNLVAKLTTRENVALPLIYNRIKKREGIAERYLEAVGLGHRLDHYPAQLSGGERQRVAIARALVNDPQIILADEPTGNLDSKSGIQVMKIIDSLNAQGKTVILVTHDPGIAAHARTVVTMKDGLVESVRYTKNRLVSDETDDIIFKGLSPFECHVEQEGYRPSNPHEEGRSHP